MKNIIKDSKNIKKIDLALYLGYSVQALYQMERKNPKRYELLCIGYFCKCQTENN